MEHFANESVWDELDEIYESREDGSNDLSCLVLEAMGNVRVNQPPFMIKYQRHISPKVVERIVDLVRAGTGHPSFFSEELLWKWALERGYSRDDVVKTTVAGCVSMTCTGKPLNTAYMTEAGFMVCLKFLEYALCRGDDFAKNGTLTRPITRDPREIKSADELLDIYLEHMEFYLEKAVISHNIGHQMLMELFPDPTNSFLCEDCLERGIEQMAYGKEFDSYPVIINVGAVNVGDSLAGVQKLVFDEKKYTMDELITALGANWEGYEVMRQDFLNVPKYGNDDDYVDNWVVKVKEDMWKRAQKIKDAWGRPFTFDSSSVIAYQAMAFGVGATPDGRMANDYVADGSRSPAAGADKKGPTAALNSMGKIPHRHTDLLNVRFNPEFLEGENKKLFAAFIESWYQKKSIEHIQFNVISEDVMREAKVKPEEYSNLQVRVAGYSAFFVDLPGATQDSLICREAHDFN